MDTNEKNERRTRVTVGASVALVLLLLIFGVAANAAMFSSVFDPSSFLNGGAFGQSKLNNGDDSTYLNDDVKTGDSADVPGEGRDKENAPIPDSIPTPETGQAATVSMAQLSQNTSPTAGSVVSQINNGNASADAIANGNANKNPGSGSGNTSGNGGAGQPTGPTGPSDNPNQGGNGGGATPGVDNDRPPAVERPAAMGGVTLLKLNQSGTAVFSTKDGKDTIDPTQNLDDLKIVAVLYDSRTGTKWTRTLTYGNVDGYTYTIASSCFPLTPNTTKITLVYYLYGNRYTVDVPCKVGDKLTVDADSKYFDYLNADQEVSSEDLAKYLGVALSGSSVDLSLCKIDGFKTDQAPGTYTATVSYAGLSATFNYTINELSINFHTPETLINCEERDWGNINGFSPTGMTTRFNGVDKLSETMVSSNLDVYSYSWQLMGDLYWTEDCDFVLGLGADPNFTTTYAKPNTKGQLDNWFVGWATADPSKAGGAVDGAWLQAHLVDSQLTAEDIAIIAKEQGTGGSVDLYPVMRTDTTIPADGYQVQYNEVTANWAAWNDSLENRMPAQLLAGFTNAVVNNGTLDVPAGVTYVSLSPYMTETEDISAYDSVKQLYLPIGVFKIDQVYPEYGWPYYSDKCGSCLSGNVLPNVAKFELLSAASNHGESFYRTCSFAMEREDGGKDTLNGIVNSENELVALPAGGVGKNDKLTMAEGSGVSVIAAVAISHMQAKSIEFASSVEQINEGALTSSQIDTIILNSAPLIMRDAFCGVSGGETFENLEHGYTSLVFRTTEVPNLQYCGWTTFLNKGTSYFDEYWNYYEIPGDDSFENLQKENIHIYVPDQATLIRCYSAWAETIDGTYIPAEGEGELAAPATAFLLRIEGEDDQSEIYTDANNVVYLRGEEGDTIMYAPPTLSGYYMVPEVVTAIAPSAFAECTELEGVIVNPRGDGKLPTLGEYAFGNPDDTGYAAPPDTLKIYISSELKGESDWRSALESQYWHTSDQEKSENASLLVDMMMENGYESYFLNSGSLYAFTGEKTPSGDDALALLRANENIKGIFEMPETTVKIGAFAFAGCEGITALTNIDNVTEIGDTAFLDCKSLNVLALPEGLESLGDSAFLACTRLEAVAFNSAPKLGTGLFEQANTPVVFLPSAANAAESDTASMRDSLASCGIQDFEDCAYSDGIYTLLHDTTSWVGETRYYRGLYTQSAAGGEKQVSFAGSRLGDVSMGDDTQSVNLDNEVTEIADGVFANQPILVGVYGGESVRKIGNGAFKDCPELRDVSMDSMFGSCVEWIGDDAFNGCENLDSFAVPRSEGFCNGAFHVGNRAFKGCKSLTTTGYKSDFMTPDFILPSGANIEIGSEAFDGCSLIPKVPLPSGNVTIGERAFAECTSLTQITITGSRAKGSLTIGEDAFCNSPLSFVNLAGAQVTVGSGALSCASNMSALFVSDGASVAEDAFPVGAVSTHVVGDCPAHVNAGSAYETGGADGIVSAVTSEYSDPDTFVAIRYPEEGLGNPIICRAGNDIVEFISYSLDDGSYILGDGAFKDNTNLIRVSFGAQYGYYGGQIIGLGDEVFKGCVNLTNTGLGDDGFGNSSPVIEIGESCYEGCTSLTSTDMNTWSPVLTIGKAAFKDCTGIEELDISLHTTTIDDEAFKGCTSLTTVNHWWAVDTPNSECKLGARAFEGCTALEAYEASAYLRSVGTDCFKGCDNATFTFIWTGDPGDSERPSRNNLPTLAEHPFGVNDDGSNIVPDAERIVIVYSNAIGEFAKGNGDASGELNAKDTNAAGLAKLFTDENGNGWLPFAHAFTYVDADGNETTNPRVSGTSLDAEAEVDAASLDGDTDAASAGVSAAGASATSAGTAGAASAASAEIAGASAAGVSTTSAGTAEASAAGASADAATSGASSADAASVAASGTSATTDAAASAPAPSLAA